MRIRFAMLILSASLTLATTAHAQQQGITYDCDTAADHYSELVLPAGPAPFVVKGNVRLMQIAAVKDYVPLTRITIGEAPAKPGDQQTAGAGFELTALPAKDKRTVFQFLSWSEIKGGKKQSHALFPTPAQESMPFSLMFDGVSVTARIADQEMTIRLATDKPVVRLVCSTGEFLYTDLTIRPLD